LLHRRAPGLPGGVRPAGGGHGVLLPDGPLRRGAGRRRRRGLAGGRGPHRWPPDDRVRVAGPARARRGPAAGRPGAVRSRARRPRAARLRGRRARVHARRRRPLRPGADRPRLGHRGRLPETLMFDAPLERTVGDAAYHVVVDGSGPPVLLLHGFPQTHLCWDRVAPALAERHTVVLADLRGYGASAAPPGGP